MTTVPTPKRWWTFPRVFAFVIAASSLIALARQNYTIHRLEVIEAEVRNFKLGATGDEGGSKRDKEDLNN